MGKKIVFTDRVRIYDTDAQGIVHYAGYYRFFTDAAEGFMRDTLGLSYPLLDERTWFVVVESEAKYFKSAKLGEELSVLLEPKLVSDKALRFDFEILVNGSKSCVGHITQVSIDKELWHAVPMPPSVLEKIRNSTGASLSSSKRNKRNDADNA
ncbi:MAG: acyl-CoA thioesterase [Candidatus Marsarchaeota archaeon]|nr:acyl-CoA thioesterase [Candidatus Marsarchaeota archaeon]MCL5102022.1 acyl-CoA thioesterase [Candidatus Marsarchaeota archaeon]